MRSWMLFLCGTLVSQCHHLKETIDMRSWMLLLGLTFVSCSTALMSREPITRSVMLAQPQAEAYSRAREALAQMGATITHSNAPVMLSGEIHNAVILIVLLDPHGTHTLLSVTGTLLPNKIVIGTMDEVDTYIAKVQAL